jgi:hypothetical protein
LDSARASDGVFEGWFRKCGPPGGYAAAGPQFGSTKEVPARGVHEVGSPKWSPKGGNLISTEGQKQGWSTKWGAKAIPPNRFPHRVFEQGCPSKRVRQGVFFNNSSRTRSPNGVPRGDRQVVPHTDSPPYWVIQEGGCQGWTRKRVTNGVTQDGVPQEVPQIVSPNGCSERCPSRGSPVGFPHMSRMRSPIGISQGWSRKWIPSVGLPRGFP